MIKTGGFSVDPAEVENAILEREEVAEAAVVGVADEHWGEEVVAFVVFREGAEIDPGRADRLLPRHDRLLQAAEADPDPAGPAEEPHREGRTRRAPRTGGEGRETLSEKAPEAPPHWRFSQ